jgi:mannitol-specific phosphotransferase system IIBC component
MGKNIQLHLYAAIGVVMTQMLRGIHAVYVPFMFTLNSKGIGILLKGPMGNVLWTIVASFSCS